MFRDQNAGRSPNIRTGNISFDRVEHLRYFRPTLTNQGFVREEEEIEVRECLLSFCAESFVVQFAVQKYKD
jgi:hypothetical protein